MTRLLLSALAFQFLATAAPAQVFTDLPGVVTTEEYEHKDPVTCTTRYVAPPENSRRRPFGHTVYDCTKGGVTFSGTPTPRTGGKTWRDW